MNKVNLNQEQNAVDSIIENVVTKGEKATEEVQSVFTLPIASLDICDVILPGMDPIPLDL